jgi:hypothetical protein
MFDKKELASVSKVSFNLVEKRPRVLTAFVRNS